MNPVVILVITCKLQQPFKMTEITDEILQVCRPPFLLNGLWLIVIKMIVL